MTRRATLIAAALALMAAGGAHAQCVTIDTASLPVPYNPFNATTGINQVVTLNVRRQGSNPPGDVDVVFLRKAGDDYPYDLVMVQDDGGSGGTRVLYTAPGPTLSTGNANAGELDLQFGNRFQPGTRQAQIRVTAPVNTDLPAGQIAVSFDVKYLCGSQTSSTSQGVLISGFTLQMTVLSALQASFVGTALDFGELGSLSAAAIAVAPDSVKKVSGNLRVASSGPYTINVRSTNGWAMTADGAATSAANARIAYQLSLVGRTARAGSEFLPRLCTRAGVAGTYLPISVTLLDGGLGKVPSSLYQDVVEVTFTPLGATEGAGATACP